MIKIEDYKGFEIFYDEDSDKFITTMELNNVVKEPKRTSLKALRQEINTFIKLNLEFKPFKILENCYGALSVKYVTAIRSDGTFVVSDSNKNTKWSSYVELKKLKESFVFDQSYIDTLKEFDLKLESIRKEKELKEKELRSKLTPLDLSKYE